VLKKTGTTARFKKEKKNPAGKIYALVSCTPVFLCAVTAINSFAIYNEKYFG
jgi:hypothetical protein